MSGGQTLYRATVLDTPENPFDGGVLRAESDAGLLVSDGAILARGSFDELRRLHREVEVVDLRGGLLLPGLVDTHVHFPQVRVIGGLGMPLLQWLEQCALPEEARLSDVGYARAVAAEFTAGLVEAGTTSAMVFGSHFASAVDAMFTQAAETGLRVTTGLVVSDRVLRDELLTTPEQAYDDGRALAERWHGRGRLRYAVTPRFSLSCGDALLASCAALLKDVPGSFFTSHLNENVAEVMAVSELFDGAVDYLDTYDRQGLVGRRSILAHNVHPTDRQLALLAGQDATVAHCPSSNSALGSGLFPLRRHREHGVRVSLGSDVGAGTGFSLLKEGLQAYFVQQVLGDRGLALAPAHLLHLATSAGAAALGLGDVVGDFSIGRQFDAVWLRPAPGGVLDVGLRHAEDPADALGKAFALAGPGDIGRVFVAGQMPLIPQVAP
jgi:guanine deaminase